MSFSLIYICCSFWGGILSVVFPTLAIFFWPAGNLECPCLFSDLILFPFLLLFFYIVPYPSFSSMSFSLIYICCSFRGGILSVVYTHCSQMFLTRREPGVPLSLFRPYPIPFLLLFFYIALTLPFLLCLFHWSISAVVSGEAFYELFFPTVAICFWPAGNRECPCLSFPILSSSLFSSFSSILFLTLPFLLCLFHCSISAVSFPGRHSNLLFFPTVAILFWPAGNLECPCLFSDLILFPFLILFFYIVPYPSFSSMSFSLIYICCSFRGGILSVVFPTVAICFWPAGNLECPCPLFRPYPLAFSPPFLLYCSLPFLFFYVFFIDLYLP